MPALHEYQEFCKNEILKRPEIALFLDCGMGKTLTALEALDGLLKAPGAGKCLIVAPKRVIEQVWPEEIEKWGYGFSYSLLAGSPKERLEALNKEASLYLISRDNLPWLAQTGFKASIIVADELSSFKSAKSKRFKALKAIRQSASRFIGLTGTPVSNGLLDLFPQMWLVDKGKTLGGGLMAYRDKYFLPDKRGASVIYSWKLKEGAEKAIREKVKPSVVSLRSQDWLDLPERVEVFHKAALSEKALKAYKAMERDFLLSFDGTAATALTAAALVGKLSQISGGAVYDDDGGWHLLFDDKLDALDTLIESLNGQPAIVYYSYRHEKERISQRHPEALDIRADGAIAAWQGKRASLLLAHPKSSGHGLNLQSGGSHIAWFSLPIGDLDLYEQSCKRLHRMGQESAVFIHHLFSEGTMDKWAYSLLKKKSGFQESFVASVAEMAGFLKKSGGIFS